MIKHIYTWWYWRKHSGNSPFGKLLVLLGIVKSPTFNLTWTPKKQKAFYEGFMKGIEQGMSQGKSKECETCVYYHEPDLVNFKECCFPWFDYTQEDAALRNCQEETKE